MSSTKGVPHLSHQRELVALFDRVRITETYQGDFYRLNKLFNANSVGTRQSQFSMDLGTDRDETIMTGISLTRLNGNVGNLRIEVTGFKKVCSFGVDFTCVTKPIISFQFRGERSGDVESRAQKLQAWQDMRGQSQYNMEYTEFQYYDANKNLHDLLGNDLLIANKMMRGVTSFERYIPVVTCTSTSANAVKGCEDEIGTRCSPGCASGWITIGDSAELLQRISRNQLGDRQWVKTADVQMMNPDSSFTRREQWTGFDEVDADLYP